MIALCRFFMFDENFLNFQNENTETKKKDFIRLGIKFLQYSQCNRVNVKYQNQLSREVIGEFVTSR